ncbi:DNA-binding transcriptional regulator, LacI/PurR family [Pedococcus dokdonensis]|uniref:DNA-binding transcriptional regulator, LacI/PurR family n=1 Tax=Pedococcus dokdonensis TaxID=443156 RepID=A0A1H0MZW2_9MICO|nr:LacI family DNA-binding transcriptional regulator [Pedococcus dokdonensis]SDO85911.1 DNA-binding transcriptional regulator, LacI/PurR family [Pedococcus dokdonensis]
MTTIGDVAKAAGVSVATVSRALRGVDRVSPHTRDRVLAAASELHYVASPAATSLVSGRTRGVGVITPYFNRWFFATVVSGIEKVLREDGYHVLLCDLEGHTFDTRLPITQTMLWKRADGAIILNVPPVPSERSVLDRLGLPVVTVGNRQPGWPSVRIDDGAAMALATRYVVDLGHRDIGYAGTVPASITHLQTPYDRREAFTKVLSDHGLVCPPEWTLECDWTAAGAAEHADRLFAQRDFPTCVVAASDEMAFGVMSAARRHGLRVPEDVSVIGIDDHVHAEIFDLTTVRQDVEAQGRRAGQIMLDALRSRAGDVVVDDVLDVELVVRGSTGPPRRAGGGQRTKESVVVA